MEFAYYYNSFQAIIKMAPFEVLEGKKKCKSLTSCWDDISNGKHSRPDILEKNIEKIKVIRGHLLVAKS